MRMYDIIHKKRDGFPLTDEEIGFVVQGCTDGSIPDYQLSALMMAIYFQGLDPHETAVLTDRMAHSGDLVDLSGIQGFKADKHSTGGVGDKTTMVVAPIVQPAECRWRRCPGVVWDTPAALWISWNPFPASVWSFPRRNLSAPSIP